MAHDALIGRGSPHNVAQLQHGAAAAESADNRSGAKRTPGSIVRRLLARCRRVFNSRHARFQVLLGLLLTLLVVTLEFAGVLTPIEKRLYDWRALNFQRYAKPPTDNLLHVDISDADLDRFGEWPWPRGIWARIIDELRQSGARVIGLDIIFDKPQNKLFEGGGDRPFIPGVNQDAALADALARMPRVIATASFQWKRSGPDPLGLKELRELLTADLQLRQDDAASLLVEHGVPAEEARRRVDDEFVALRKQVMRKRIGDIIRGLDPGLAELQRTLLPRSGPGITGEDLVPVLNDQYEQAKINKQIARRFERSPEAGLPQPIEAADGLLPVLPITHNLNGLGFADYVVPPDDAVVRAVPLWALHGNRLMPQFGLAVACAMLDVSPDELRLEPKRIVIPAKGSRAEIAIPVHTETFDEFGDVGFMMDVPWLGTPRWNAMYDFPAHAAIRRHQPIAYVWGAVLARGSIEANDRKMDEIVRQIKAEVNEDASKPLPPPGDPTRETRALEWADVASGLADASPTMGQAAAALRKLVDTQPKLRARLAEVRQAVEGRAVLIGWVATGNVDIYPTSIHARCPGVVVHGTVLNAILTGEFWRRPPAWVGPVVTFGVGLLATLLVAGLSPVRAMFAVLALEAAYAVLNFVVLFDRGNLLINAGGPLVAGGCVWAGVTLLGFVNEVWERNRVVDRFRSHVDPTLVDYVLDHQGEAVFERHDHEMTVVFTDLQGFTSLSETLRNEVVKLLRQYMELMVPAIRKRNGLVNKFLGDGIMFFFGAPLENPRHAANAMDTVLELQRLLVRFKQSLKAEDRLTEDQLAGLQMRAGVASGKMYVGNAGPSFASDFTVLGDRVNLASRLESANKVTGTGNLVTARTLSYEGTEEFLARPVAKLVVAGRKESALVYEVLCRKSEADERTRLLVSLSTAVFEAYQAGDLVGCRASAQRMRAELGVDPASERFTDFYLQRCDGNGRLPGEPWDGHIELAHK